MMHYIDDILLLIFTNNLPFFLQKLNGFWYNLGYAWLHLEKIQAISPYSYLGTLVMETVVQI